MGLKEELKKSSNRELSDDELGKVAGGKWDENDFEAGMTILLWENEAEWNYWYISAVNGTWLEIHDFRIQKSDVKTFTHTFYNSYDAESAAKKLNSLSPRKTSFPPGFYPGSYID